MKTLSRIREIILESKDLIIPRGHLNIPRFQMPQIKKENYPEFLRLLDLRNISIQRVKIPANQLLAAQNEINHDKVKEWMVSMPIEAREKPLLVSSDLYVLDGNHTWLAILNRDENASIDSWILGLEMEDLLKEIKLFDKITYKTIDEHCGIINTLKGKMLCM
jgi:hypothetical protein